MNATDIKTSYVIKAGLAKMLKGGVIMDVINVEQFLLVPVYQSMISRKDTNFMEILHLCLTRTHFPFGVLKMPFLSRKKSKKCCYRRFLRKSGESYIFSESLLSLFYFVPYVQVQTRYKRDLVLIQYIVAQ